MPKLWKQFTLAAWWITYVSWIGPALISHASYELPLLGGVLFFVGLYITYRVFNPKKEILIK